MNVYMVCASDWHLIDDVPIRVEVWHIPRLGEYIVGRRIITPLGKTQWSNHEHREPDEETALRRFDLIKDVMSEASDGEVVADTAEWVKNQGYAATSIGDIKVP